MLNPNARDEIENTGDASTLLQRLEERSCRPVQRNEGQEKAVDHVLKHRTGFVWGPPGTGKTTTLGMAVASLTLAGESVLVLSHSNMAVDTAMKSVAQHLKNMPLYEEGQVIRFGIPTPSTLKDYKMLRAKNIIKRQHPELIARMKELRSKRKSLNRKIIAPATTPYHRKQLDGEVEEIKKQLTPLTEKLKQYENQLVRVAEVVGCTLSKAIISPEIFQRQFDAVIVDEASMVSIPHCVFASTLAKRRISIFGDFRQLAPIAQSSTPEADKWLKRDIFDQAGITTKVNNNQSDSRMVQLNTQYRMHPSISAIPNELCYGNSLRDGMNVAEQTEKIASKRPYPGHPLVLYDLSYISASCSKEKESHSRFNLISALLAANLAYQSAESDADTSVGIISPYKAQSRLLHRILQDAACSNQIKASTVHRFQGSEQNVIIFDAVDSAPQDKVGLLLNGGMSNSTAMRLSNVAISRSKGKFIALINTQFVKNKLSCQYNFFGKFTHRLQTQAHVEFLLWQAFDNKDQEFVLPGVTYFQNRDDARKTLEEDFQSVEELTAIYWPSRTFRNHVDLGYFISANQRGVGFYISGQSAGEDDDVDLVKSEIWNSDQQDSVGLIGFDSKLIWVALNPNSADAMLLRIELPKTVELLYTYFSLVPQSRPTSVASKLKRKEHPFGSCRDCKQPLWVRDDRRTPYIGCLSVPHHHRRKLTPNDATLLAEFMRLSCEQCQSKLKGCKNPKDLSIFWGCSASCGHRGMSLRI